jgi:membrane protease YdiL (CAAX protease family)
MWETWSVTETVAVVLPLVIVILAGLVPSRHEPDTPFLANQRWRYRDLIIVFCVLSVSVFVSPARVLTRMGMLLSAIIAGSTALLIIVSVWGVVRRRQRRPWRALGFDPTTALTNTLWSLRIGLGVISGLTVLVILIRLGAAGTDAAIISATGRWVWQGQLGGFLAACVVTAVIGPITEELVFRGLAYGPLFRKFGAAGAALGSAAIWSAAHYSGLSYSGLSKMAFLLVLGIGYAKVYRRRESVVPTVVFHIVGNTAGIFIRDRTLEILVPLAGVSAGLWILTAVLFGVGSRRHIT